jgi:putative Mg2+ transporter-C (MgtC) family protein
MIQANVLLPTAGKPQDSYVVLDLMRLPLGILSGMGFIGAGAIVRRNDLVLGVTTAATLWFVTVLGLCFGGGQIALGLTGLVLGAGIVTGMRHIERRIKQERVGTLTILMRQEGPSEDEIRVGLMEEQYALRSFTLAHTTAAATNELRCQVTWHARENEMRVPELVRALMRRPGVVKVRWSPQTR